MTRSIRCALLTLAVPFAAVQAQDANYLLPVDTLEERLRSGPLDIIDIRGSRAEGDRTQRVTLRYPDGAVFVAKLAKAPTNGSAFNNEPRYELAAYELQKLFLSQDEYTVPPTVIRSVPLDWMRRYDQYAGRTFNGVESVVVVLQYWLLQVSPDDFYDRDRLEEDTVYARYFGNFNVFTYLIRHNDSNEGNFLISRSQAKPRVFSVDNGLAFNNEVSDRGYYWRTMRVDRLPHATVERLRAITPELLREKLSVLVQFENRGGTLVPVERGPNLDDRDGVRRSGDIVQLGLTEREINGIESRLRSLLEDIDKGDIEVF